MSEAHPLLHGHVVFVVTPRPGAEPAYRGCVVLEETPEAALAIVTRHVLTDETRISLAPSQSG